MIMERYRRRPVPALTMALALVTVGAVMFTSGQVASASSGLPALATGVVTDGGAAVEGAVITLTAWPTADYLAGLPDDAAVPTQDIAVTTSAADGSYNLATDLSSLGSDYVYPDGTVNLEETTVTAASTVSYDFDGAVPSSEAADDVDYGDAVPGSAPITLDPDMTGQMGHGVGPGLVTDSVPAMKTAASAAQFRVMQADAVSPQDTPPQPCSGWTASTTYHDRSEKFIDAWPVSSAHATVTEDIGSSHKLGIGISIDGGSWEAHGTTTIEKTTGSSAAITYSSPRRLANQVSYRKYRQSCPGGVNGPGGTTYQVRPNGFDALQPTGLATNIAPMTSWTHCVYYDKGQFGKTTGSNVEFSAGVSAPYISLNVQAAYSKHTQISWNVTSRTYLCGDTAGFASARRGAAKLWSSSCGGGGIAGEGSGDGVKPDC
jgi:hypothetical protein